MRRDVIMNMIRKSTLAVILCANISGCAIHYREEQIAQENNACREVGINPGSYGFAACVADLDASIFADSQSAEH
jgi:hypothetical protein